MVEIIDYIKQVYEPLSIILYGSYADGSHNEHSDFDALVVSKKHEVFHDTSVINGIRLDVFVYPSAYFDRAVDCGEFLQVFDGDIILDTNGQGASLKQKVLSYMKEYPFKTADEVKDEIEWCKKMLERTDRPDAEGVFRWHWLLTDSLEIFCDTVHHMYLGPKKTLRWMKNNYPRAFQIYEAALRDFRQEVLREWILYLEQLALSENT